MSQRCETWICCEVIANFLSFLFSNCILSLLWDLTSQAENPADLGYKTARHVFICRNIWLGIAQSEYQCKPKKSYPDLSRGRPVWAGRLFGKNWILPGSCGLLHHTVGYNGEKMSYHNFYLKYKLGLTSEILKSCFSPPSPVLCRPRSRSPAALNSFLRLFRSFKIWVKFRNCRLTNLTWFMFSILYSWVYCHQPFVRAG